MNKKNLLPLFAIVIITLLVYFNSYTGLYYIDDYTVIVNNGDIRDFHQINPFQPRGVLMYTFALNYYLGGLNPVGYHFFNIILHTINGILIFYLAYSLFFRLKKEPKKATFAALVGALIFVTHPLHVGSVTHISSRSSVLMTTFYLLSLLLFVKSLNDKKWLYLPLSLITFGLAVLSKTTAVTLPLIIILYDLCFGASKSGFRKFLSQFKNYYCFYFLILVVGAFFSKINISAILTNSTVNQHFGSAYEYLLTGFKSKVYYLKLIFIPANYSLEYYVKLTHSFFELSFLAAFVLIVFIAITGILFYKKHKWITFSIYWFLITLVPLTTMIVIRDFVTDRWAYLPSIGPIIFIAGLISFLAEKPFKIKLGKFKFPLQKFVIVLFLIILIIFSTATIQRNSLYSDQEKLYKSSLEVYPDSIYALLGLANHYYNQGEFDEAENLCWETVRVYANTSFTARLLLGKIEIKRGNYEKALIHLKKSLEAEGPEQYYISSYYYLAKTYTKLNQTEQARYYLNKSKDLSQTINYIFNYSRGPD